MSGFLNTGTLTILTGALGGKLNTGTTLRQLCDTMQGDVAGDESEAARAQAALSQRKSLRPSLTRSPTVNKTTPATEKPGAAMVSWQP